MEKKKILLVDDDQDLVLAISAMLTGHNFDVATANSKAEGLEKIKEVNPDMVVLDVNMETPSAGFEMNRELRTSEEFKSVPILMLTGIDVMTTGVQIVDMYREMRGTPGFDENLVLKVKSADGTVAVDYKGSDGKNYWLPLDGFLGKPVEEEELVEKINKLLS